jgi:hypothetical protein
MKLSTLTNSMRHTRELKNLLVDQLHNRSDNTLPLIVSFTSIPSRFHVIHFTVRSVLNGTHQPEKIVLWLNDAHRGKLPESLEKMEGRRFEIRYASEDSPHLKLMRSLLAFPDKTIVTCDDDLIYPDNWLQSLHQDHLKYPHDIIAHECRTIAYNENQTVLPYRYWYREGKKGVSYDALLPLGFGGVLYPVGCFHKDVCDTEKYLKSTPKADDLWFKAMSYLNGTKSRRTTSPCNKAVPILNSQSISLRSYNINQDGNRIQWQALVDQYQLTPLDPWPIHYLSNSLITKSEQPSNNKPIDAVVTWVDGDDPAHSKKLNDYLVQTGQKNVGAATPTRFKDIGEISYCVMSLLQFAPWLRHVYIVTDAQKPKIAQWLSSTPYADKVKIVDHREIFKGNEDYLPTFNTRSISSQLWKIADLSEHFIFLNDDYILVKPVQPSDFFLNDKIILRGTWHQTIWGELRKNIRSVIRNFSTEKDHVIPRAKYVESQKLAANLSGYSGKYFHLEHNPHPIRRERFNNHQQEKPQEFRKQVSFKLRSIEQYTAESLSAHLEMADNNALIDNKFRTMQIKPETQSRKRIKRKLQRVVKDPAIAFVCIQSMDNASQKVRDLVFSKLMSIIGTLEIAKHDRNAP